MMLVKGSSMMKLGKVKKHVLNSKLNQEKMACFAYILRTLGLILFIYSSSLLTNGKALEIHSAWIKSGLLDSK